MTLFAGWFIKKANPDAERNHLNKILQDIDTQLASAVAGSVTTVVDGTGIDVDSTDPNNPEVSLDAGTQASLLLADTSLQPGDNISELTNDVGYTTNSGTVTSVGTGTGLTGGPVTTTGTISLNASSIASLALADTSVQDLSDLGITATATELNYVDGVTSSIQDQLDGKDSAGSGAAALVAANIYTDDEIADLGLVYLPLSGTTPGLEMFGDIAFSQASVLILGNTTSGNDTQRIAISASETVSTARSANVLIHGIDHATSPGVLQLNAGTGADVVLNPGAGGSCRPNTNNARDLASSSFQWANTWTVNLRMSGLEFHTGIGTPAQITANQNDYTPSALATSRVLRLSTDASRNITGLGAGTDGQRLTILNVGAQDIVLTHNDVASVAANRFRCPGAASFTIRRDGGVELIYEETSDRWRVIAP